MPALSALLPWTVRKGRGRETECEDCHVDSVKKEKKIEKCQCTFLSPLCTAPTDEENERCSPPRSFSCVCCQQLWTPYCTRFTIRWCWHLIILCCWCCCSTLVMERISSSSTKQKNDNSFLTSSAPGKIPMRRNSHFLTGRISARICCCMTTTITMQSTYFKSCSFPKGLPRLSSSPVI